MRRTEELRGSNIFPPQVTIAAGRMVQEGMLPEDTTLPVNLEEGKNLFEGYLKNRTGCVRQSFIPTEGEQMAAFENVSVKYRAVKGKAPKILDHST